jgi:hypothetical protein
MKKVTKLVVLILGLLFVGIPVYYYGIESVPRYGLIAGKVTIGPFCPVVPQSGCPPPPGTYTTRQVVLTSELGDQQRIPLNETGYFNARVKVGTYELSLTNCTYLGCEFTLPMMVEITPNQTTKVSIEIDTGIR